MIDSDLYPVFQKSLKAFSNTTESSELILIRSAPLALSALLATSDPPGFVDLLDVLLLANKFLFEADRLINTYL